MDQVVPRSGGSHPVPGCHDDRLENLKPAHGILQQSERKQTHGVVVMSSSPIVPDQNALVAIESIITGANVHEARGLISLYTHWCYLGNEEEVVKARMAMARFVMKELLKKERNRRAGEINQQSGAFGWHWL